MTLITRKVSALAIVSCITGLLGCAAVPNPGIAACPANANMLIDPTFATVGKRGKRVWRSRAHSNSAAFTSNVDGDLLTIENVGKEPWYVFSQRIDGPLPTGTELQLDALLTLDTQLPAAEHGFGYVSGLYLTGSKVRRIMVRSMAEHEPNIGRHPEQRVAAKITADTDLTRLEAGFIHQAGGSLSIREPRLVNLTQFPGCRLP